MLMFERDRYLGMGGLDPSFGRGDFEDLELSQRWKQQQGDLSEGSPVAIDAPGAAVDG